MLCEFGTSVSQWLRHLCPTNSTSSDLDEFITCARRTNCAGSSKRSLLALRSNAASYATASSTKVGTNYNFLN